MAKQRTFALGIFITIIALIAGCVTPTSHPANAPAFQSGYAPVNGLKMYYEIHGSDIGKSPPLVLLHGGGSTIGTSFGKILPALAKDRQVIAILPDTDHRAIVKRSDWLHPMIGEFLDNK